jgi:outer membrane receptor protein involved in Fe transport
VKLYAEIESWSLDNLEHPWHKPALKFGLDGHYQIQNKIIIRANAVARGSQYARIVNASDQFAATELDAFVDLSLGVEYRYTKVLSGFINFNNITNSQYFLWNNYPSYKFNLMGGVAYSF